MALEAGTAVGPYKIVRALGRGGMGEVYVATDGRLGREVAVKRMHPGLGAGPERLRRFEQEARAASAINHPNILSVFDVGELDGAPYIVTELLEGDTLRDLLNGGPIGVRKALDLGRQVALGLAAAHERGIVHRDIKPENLFVTKEGHLKILDFGVAKLTGLGDEVVNDDRPTTPALTTPDAILGTPGYMAPEQVKGEDVDHRADLFSLGAVLYEMITGKRAFAGKGQHAVMYQVLHGDPPAIADTGVPISPVVEAVVRRCMEKRRDERFASARDLAFQLEALATGVPTVQVGATVDVRPPRRRRGSAVVVPGLLIVATAAATYALWPRATPPPPTPPPQVAAAPATPDLPDRVPALKPLTFRTGRISSARASRDGRMVYVGAAWNGAAQQLWSIAVGHPEMTALGIEGDVEGVTRAGDIAVLIGPWDGMEHARTLALIPPSGGSRRELAEDIEFADVGADDQLAVVHRVGARDQIEYPIGTVIDQTDGWFSHVRISPDGKRLAYLVHPMRDDDRGSPMIAELGGAKKAITDEWGGTQGISWDPAGRGIYFSATKSGQRAIYYGGDGAPPRRLAQVTANLDVDDVLPDGSLLGVMWQWDTSARMHVPGGSGDVDASWFDTTNPIDLAPDGKTLLFLEGGLAAMDSVYLGYLRRADGEVIGLGAGVPLRLSPDGKQILWLDPAKLHISLVPTGAGASRAIDTGDLSVQAAWWFPDGKRILLAAAAPGVAERLWTMSLDGGAPVALTEPGQTAARQDRPISPDGRRISYQDATGARATITVDGKPAPSPPVADGEHFVGWADDGRAWLVARAAGGGYAIAKVDPDGKHTALGTAAPPDPAGTIAPGYLQVTPDGRGWAFAYYTIASRAYQITLVPSTSP